MPRWLGWLAGLGVVCAMTAMFGLWPVHGFDLSFHRLLGRLIWTTGDVPRVDSFSYMSEGAPFLDHSWLAQLIFHGIDQGAPDHDLGFRVWRLVLIAMALGFAVQTARTLNASWSVLILLAPFVLTLLWARVECRPALLSTLFLAAELWLLLSMHTARRSWRWLLTLPPMMSLWVNIHGGWISGMLMLAAITGAVGIMHVRRRYLETDTPISHLPFGRLLNQST